MTYRDLEPTPREEARADGEARHRKRQNRALTEGLAAPWVSDEELEELRRLDRRSVPQRILDFVYWPPLALAQWVNAGPGRTDLDRAFYSALYVAGWTAILAILAVFGIGEALRWTF